MTGGYAGGQAEYLRVPFANFTHFRVPEDSEVADEALALLADVLPLEQAADGYALFDGKEDGCIKVVLKP